MGFGSFSCSFTVSCEMRYFPCSESFETYRISLNMYLVLIPTFTEREVHVGLFPRPFKTTTRCLGSSVRPPRGPEEQHLRSRGTTWRALTMAASVVHGRRALRPALLCCVYSPPPPTPFPSLRAPKIEINPRENSPKMRHARWRVD